MAALNERDKMKKIYMRPETILLSVDEGPMLSNISDYSSKSGTNVVEDSETNTSSETTAPKTGDDTKYDGGGGPLEAKHGIWQYQWE